MLTLGKIERYADTQRLDIAAFERDMTALYKSSGLEAALRGGSETNYHGYLTAEPTPGHVNFNRNRQLAAVRFYENDPETRRGYYAKLQIMPDGSLQSI